METNNLFANIPARLPEELVNVLVRSEHVRIERIVSHGHTSPPEFWYDQDENEWVIVLKGKARLRFKDDGHLLEMNPGDHVNIPAHVLHRVEWTGPNEETIWLAVFY